MPDLLLEQGFGFPKHPGIGAILHQKERGLPMMYLRQYCRSVPHLILVDGLGERVTAGFHQRCLDLSRHAFKFRIGHREPQLGPRQIFERHDVLRVVATNHDRQLIRHVGNGGAG